MDRILKGYLESFAQTFELTKFNEAELFEYFCNYTILSKIHPGRFSLEQVSTEQAPGLDGIVIFVNDHMVSSTEEIDDLIRDNNLYATFCIYSGEKIKYLRYGEYQ